MSIQVIEPLTIGQPSEDLRARFNYAADGQHLADARAEQDRMPRQGLRLFPGDIIKTSYESGPYRIETISGPCTCQPPNSNWNLYCIWPVQCHYHLVVTDMRPLAMNLKKDGSFKKGGSYLGFYIEQNDGRFTSILGLYDYLSDKPTGREPDEIFLVERAPRSSQQLTLF